MTGSRTIVDTTSPEYGEAVGMHEIQQYTAGRKVHCYSSQYTDIEEYGCGNGGSGHPGTRPFPRGI